MFYLTLYFGLFKRDFVVSILHFGLLMLIVFSVIKTVPIQKFIYSMLTDYKGNSHFYTIMSKEINSSKISQKISELPGIKQVLFMSSNDISQQTHKFFSSVELTEFNHHTFDLIGLKIIFERGLKLESMELVRNYLKRLFKAETFIVGDIKNIESNDNHSFLITYAGVFLTTLLCFFWLIINHFMAKKIQQNAYIVEQFQRKTFVALKTYILSTTTLMIIPFIVTFAFIQIPLLSLASVFLALLIGAVNYKTVKWQE